MNARGLGRLGGLAVGLGIGAALAATPGTASADDMQISIDGMDLFPTAGNTATATSGMGDIAIAIGNGSTADAFGGTGDFALADGTNSDAGAGGTGPFGALGTGSNDSAIDIGNNTGTQNGAEAGAGNNDIAIDFGNNTGSLNGPLAGNLGNNAFAIDVGNNTGNFLGPSAGTFDLASIFGNNDIAFAGSPGNFDLAAVFGDMLNATATGGNFLVDILPSL
jgi:hypothetical protein